MDNLQLLVDLHADSPRQGPGGEYETNLAIALSGLKEKTNLCVADIGCGSGAATLVLANELDAHVTAVDLQPTFIARLQAAVTATELEHRITPVCASMDALPFAAGSYDAIFAEGAIYSMGFAAGVEAWGRFLKPNGILAVSELTWLTSTRPRELQAFWAKEYPEVDTAANKMAILERFGFAPIGYFVLGEHCWLDNYYRPLQQRFPGFLKRHDQADAARALVTFEQQEISLYERYKNFFGYGYYIARYMGA